MSKSPFTPLLSPKIFEFVNGNDCVPEAWEPYLGKRGVGTPVKIGASERGAAKAGGCARYRAGHKIKNYIASIKDEINRRSNDVDALTADEA